MVNFDDFRDKKGNVNWTSYNRACQENGEQCYQCGRFILFSKGPHRQKCPACKALDAEIGEVSHHTLIRCPYCLHYSSIFDVSEDYTAYEEGEHSVYCPMCVFKKLKLKLGQRRVAIVTLQPLRVLFPPLRHRSVGMYNDVMLVPPATHLDPAKTGLHGHTYSSLPAHKEIRSLAGMVDTDPEGSSESPLEVLLVEGEPPEFELAAVLGMQFKMGLLPPEADEPPPL